MDKFSVLIANYNNGKYLETAIKSVFSQTYQNFEIVIVDDASTDNSWQIYDKYQSDNRFKIKILPENHGVGYAKRSCAELASGEICGFLDSDDAISETAIEDMIKAHKEHPDTSLIYSGFYFCDKNLSIKSKREFIVHKAKNFLYEQERDLHFATFKKTFYDKTCGIDPLFKRAVDQDLYLKLDEIGKFAHIPKYHYYYRIHNKSISSTDEVITKAFYWNIAAHYNACVRRGVDFDTVPFVYPLTNNKAVKTIFKILVFLRKFRKLIKGY